MLSCTGTLATTLGAEQPFRYRGYVYDAETGWYYLQSRYYDPSIGRFISADVLLSTGQGVIGNNSYAYCRNNPVNRIDYSGFTDSNISNGDGDTKWWEYLLMIFFSPLFITGCSPNNSASSSIDVINNNFIACDSRRIKCYGYALSYVEQEFGVVFPESYKYNPPQQPAVLGEPIPYNLEDVAEFMAIRIISMGLNAEISNHYDKVTDGQLIIAVRTGDFFLAGSDYHFGVLLNDGSWAGKRGTRKASYGTFDSIFDGYDSDTVYIIVST